MQAIVALMQGLACRSDPVMTVTAIPEGVSSTIVPFRNTSIDHVHQIGTILLRECRDQIRDDKHFRAFVVNRTWGQYHPESGGLLPSIEDKSYLDGTMCDLVQGCGKILVHFAFERWCSLGDIRQTTVQGRVGRSTRRVDRNTKPRHPSEHQCKRSGRP